MKKIECSNPTCDGTFAHLLSDKTMDVMRQKQQFIITGRDWVIIGTCGKCGKKSTFTVSNGKFDETGVSFKVDQPPVSDNPQPVA